MKKHLLKTSVLSCIAALAFSFPNLRTGSLKDITKPYLGEYECDRATVGEKDYLENFAYIRLELEKDNNFVLHYKTKEGVKGEQTGKYTYDEKERAIYLSLGANGELKRKIPLDKGKLSLSFPLGSQIFCLEFTQK